MKLSVIKAMSKIAFNLYKEGLITIEEINNKSVKEEVEKLIEIHNKTNEGGKDLADKEATKEP